MREGIPCTNAFVSERLTDSWSFNALFDVKIEVDMGSNIDIIVGAETNVISKRIYISAKFAGEKKFKSSWNLNELISRMGIKGIAAESIGR